MVFNSFDAKTFFIFVIIHVIIVIQCGRVNPGTFTPSFSQNRT